MFGNFEMLIGFIEKHCQECPKFAADFERFNNEMIRRTMTNLQITSAEDTRGGTFASGTATAAPTTIFSG